MTVSGNECAEIVEGLDEIQQLLQMQANWFFGDGDSLGLLVLAVAALLLIVGILIGESSV